MDLIGLFSVDNIFIDLIGKRGSLQFRSKIFHLYNLWKSIEITIMIINRDVFCLIENKYSVLLTNQKSIELTLQQ